MGRYLLWRTALTAALLAAVVFPAAPDTVGPLTPLLSIQGGQPEKQTSCIEPRQIHAGPKAWTDDIGRALKERPEIETWIKKWSTEKGLRKLRLSRNLAFEFRSEVRSILRNAEIPWELTSIPIVESNWRVNAVSSSGAVGPWQFLESTGRGRDLIIDAWRDERRDIWRSTKAASEELLFSYRLFKDWPLTIAAYNAGPTRLRKLKESENFFDFWTMLDGGVIPPETQNYVPQVIAVSYIQAHAGRMGLPIEWKSPTKWLTVPLPHSLHLSQLAEIPGMDKDLLIAGNQELHHPVTPPASQEYAIKIPAGRTDFTEVKRTILTQKDAPERFWRYTVRTGDTLSGISAAYNIPVNVLLRYNSLRETGVLRIGEQLYIPGTHNPPEGVESDELPAWEGRYRVKPGDSLWSIARHFRISPELLADVNYRPLLGILAAGSVLRVPKIEVNP